jgi:electron transfer flavoprotein alpha subunit
MKILIIAEHDNKILKTANFHTLTAATQFCGTIDFLIVGYNCQSVADEAGKLPAVQRVLVQDAKEYEHQLAENVSVLIAEIGKQYDVILAAATTFGKNLLPRAAALLDTAMISDVIKILSTDTFVRPIYAGNALATVTTLEKIKILTIRITGFPAAKLTENHQAKIEMLQQIIPNELSEFVDQQLTISARPELTDARIVVSGGRGFKNAENFKMLEVFADSIGAAVGASRAAVDAGFAPNDYQVGQTGKAVAPDLYIAIGISGAIQHLAGMKDSKVIVAINSDPDAPIFQIADYGLVGDLFKILPELQKELSDVHSTPA